MAKLTDSDKKVLVALKGKLVEKYGEVKELLLPSGKVLFLVPPTEHQYNLYVDQVSNVLSSKQNKKKITNMTLLDAQKILIKSCTYTDTSKVDCLATFEDVSKYPAVYAVAYNKIEEMAGANIDEDFLLE